MFTALEIVFSCTFCISKPFVGVQYSLHKYKGEKSPQFRLLSYSAEIINGDRLSLLGICLNFPPPGADVEPFTLGAKLKALQLLKSPLGWELLFVLWRRV